MDVDVIMVLRGHILRYGSVVFIPNLKSERYIYQELHRNLVQLICSLAEEFKCCMLHVMNYVRESSVG